MARKFDLVVFDWDGTVMDSTEAIVACIQEAARDLGFEAPHDSVASHVIGLGLNDALQKAIPSLKPEAYPTLVQRYVAHWRAREHEMTLFDGMRELLDELKHRDYRLAVATGKSRAWIARWRMADFPAYSTGPAAPTKPTPSRTRRCCMISWSASWLSRGGW